MQHSYLQLAWAIHLLAQPDHENVQLRKAADRPA